MIAGALRLNPDAFASVADHPQGMWIALGVLLVAGASHAVGQSVALFAARVSPKRFAASLALGSASFALSVVVWGLVLAVLGWAFGRDPEPASVVRVVGLAHAPRLLSFLILTPYFGSALSAALTTWTFLALATGARGAFDVGIDEALVAFALAWLVTEGLTRTVQGPYLWVRRRLRRRRTDRTGARS